MEDQVGRVQFWPRSREEQALRGLTWLSQRGHNRTSGCQENEGCSHLGTKLRQAVGWKGAQWEMRHSEEEAGMKGLGNTGTKPATEAVLGSKPCLQNQSYWRSLSEEAGTGFAAWRKGRICRVEEEYNEPLPVRWNYISLSDLHLNWAFLCYDWLKPLWANQPSHQAEMLAHKVSWGTFPCRKWPCAWFTLCKVHNCFHLF